MIECATTRRILPHAPHGQYVVTTVGKWVTSIEIAVIFPQINLESMSSIWKTTEGCLQRATDTLCAIKSTWSNVRCFHQKWCLRGDGLVGGIMAEVMLDSGSSVSLVRHDIAKRFKWTSAGNALKLRLVSAGGESSPLWTTSRRQWC